MPDFVYQDPFPLAPDSTKYRRLDSESQSVSTARFEGEEILKIKPEALQVLAQGGVSRCLLPLPRIAPCQGGGDL